MSVLFRLRIYGLRPLYTLTRTMSGSRPTHLERTKDASRGSESGVTVEAVSQLTPTVKGFSIRSENKDLSFKPGQWVDVRIPSVDTVGGYSITSPPHLLREKGLFTLAIQHSSHPPTLWMTRECRVGDQLSVRVGGDFIYDPAPSGSHGLLLVAGGVGINPLISMLLHHTREVGEGRLSGTRVRLLYTARTVCEVLFKEQIDQLCSRHSWFTAQYFVTRQEPTQPHNINYRRLEERDILAALQQASGISSYVCGPPNMIDSVSQWLVRSGLPQKNIHIEKWW